MYSPTLSTNTKIFVRKIGLIYRECTMLYCTVFKVKNNCHFRACKEGLLRMWIIVFVFYFTLLKKTFPMVVMQK